MCQAFHHAVRAAAPTGTRAVREPVLCPFHDPGGGLDQASVVRMASTITAARATSSTTQNSA